MEEGYEDDDDTHFCIKCHATINGLENYVRHRQSGGCRSAVKSGVIPHSTPPSTPTTVSYPEILNADAFFSSLELQSSSKKESLRRAATPSERGRKSERQETRRRTRKSQADADDASTKVQTQEKLHNMLPIVTDLDNPTDQLGIPSLVGFPDIVTPTAGKSATVPSGKACIQQIHPSKLDTTNYHVKSESLPETSLDGLMVGGAETKHDRKRQEEQEWLDDGILVDLVAENKEMAHSNLTRYAEFDSFQQDEESDDESLDDDLGEEESYSETSDPEDRKYPPQGHTGGKWKPELEIIPQDMGEEEAENDEDQHEHPPPSYTGGKWKPTEDPVIRMDRPAKVEYESKDTQPPPGHTKGKWVPGARADVATGYWCSPCGRKLASRVVYDRHLLSDLHARRSMQEIDGVLRLPRGVRPLSQRRGTSRRQRALALKSREAAEPEEEAGGWRLRRREKEVLWCEMCHARVRRPQMGKHLLSHYHCHVAGANPRTAKARRFLLENMANVVRQCPFQCAACRFYCNTEDTFLLHWRSSLHRSTHSEIRGSYQCTPCDFWCDDGDEMESHVISSAHREVVSLINGSVPVVVRRQRPLNCGSCDRRFRYNLQLRIHAKEMGHEALTGSDDYQRRLECSLCSQIFRSLISLQRHQLTSHADDAGSNGIEVDDSPRPAPYFCSFCSLNFTTAKEAVLHRRTSSHKETVRATKATAGASASTVRECPHCGERRPNLVQHKEHLLRSHPELCHKCPRCGMLFALPQDVSRHTKDTNCSASGAQTAADATKDGEAFACDRCDFATDSRAEFLFHQALHAGSVNTPSYGSEEDEARGSGEVRRKYRCPVCPKTFVKVTLRNHLRLHTGERPFPCRKCFASFSRRSALNAHLKECTSTTTNWGDPPPARPRDHVCSECNNAFYTKHALRQHTLRHAGKKFKCRLPGCPTVLRTAAELRTHRRLVHYSTEFDRTHRCMRCAYAAKTATQLRRHQKKHQTLPEEVDAADAPDGLVFSCRYPDCSFRTKLKSHLTRHVRCHTGSKPYKCRHCAYASNNLENLRKHVVSTNLHPGKTIYECDYCAEGGFCTNFAKELRAHLLEVHGDRFPTPVHSSDYVAGIFEGDLLRRTSPR